MREDTIAEVPQQEHVNELYSAIFKQGQVKIGSLRS